MDSGRHCLMARFMRFRRLLWLLLLLPVLLLLLLLVLLLLLLLPVLLLLLLLQRSLLHHLHNIASHRGPLPVRRAPLQLHAGGSGRQQAQDLHGEWQAG